MSKPHHPEVAALSSRLASSPRLSPVPWLSLLLVPSLSSAVFAAPEALRLMVLRQTLWLAVPQTFKTFCVLSFYSRTLFGLCGTGSDNFLQADMSGFVDVALHSTTRSQTIIAFVPLFLNLLVF
jgi:hypothetical protein